MNYKQINNHKQITFPTIRTTTSTTATNSNNNITTLSASTFILDSYYEIKISSLNTHGIKANHQIVNLLAQVNDVVCIQELIDTNEEICKSLIKVSSRDIHVMPSRRTDGRPAGGIMFVVKSEIKHEVNFINGHIGVLKIGKLAIINVYLVYNAGSVENSMEYQLQLTQLLELIKKLKRKEKEIFILGDFNVDLHLSKCTNDVISKKRRRQDFNSFLRKSNMVPSDVLNVQRISYTYWQGRENVLYVSHIDHILIEKSCKLQFQSNIQTSRINSSDHNPVQLSLETLKNEIKTLVNNKFIKQRKKNWLNINFSTAYRSESSKMLKAVIDSLREY